MAQFEDEFDMDDTESSGTDLVKQLRKQVNELSKALKEREQEVAEFYTMSREQEIGEALSDMGINPKIAAFVPDDVEDYDDLSAWLGEYGDVFGLAATDDDGVNMDADQVQAAELMSAVEEGGFDPGVGQDLEARIASASSPEELAALLKS